MIILLKGFFLFFVEEKKIGNDVLGQLTLDEVRVVGLMRRQHCRHLVVVGGVHVLVDAISGQLYLLRASHSSTQSVSHLFKRASVTHPASFLVFILIFIIASF